MFLSCFRCPQLSLLTKFQVSLNTRNTRNKNLIQSLKYSRRKDLNHLCSVHLCVFSVRGIDLRIVCTVAGCSAPLITRPRPKCSRKTRGPTWMTQGPGFRFGGGQVFGSSESGYDRCSVLRSDEAPVRLRKRLSRGKRRIKVIF